MFWFLNFIISPAVKYVLNGHSEEDQKIGFKTDYRLREHSAILFTFIKLPFVVKTFDLSILGWPFQTGLTELRLGDFVAFLVTWYYFEDIMA